MKAQVAVYSCRRTLKFIVRVSMQIDDNSAHVERHFEYFEDVFSFSRLGDIRIDDAQEFERLIKAMKRDLIVMLADDFTHSLVIEPQRF